MIKIALIGMPQKNNPIFFWFQFSRVFFVLVFFRDLFRRLFVIALTYSTVLRIPLSKLLFLYRIERRRPKSRYGVAEIQVTSQRIIYT